MIEELLYTGLQGLGLFMGGVVLGAIIVWYCYALEKADNSRKHRDQLLEAITKKLEV